MKVTACLVADEFPRKKADAALKISTARFSSRFSRSEHAQPPAHRS